MDLMFFFSVHFLMEAKFVIFFVAEQSAAEERKMKEEKKRMLLRKLSFRPTVEELKEKKVWHVLTYLVYSTKDEVMWTQSETQKLVGSPSPRFSIYNITSIIRNIGGGPDFG
jgi:hypothetical protein